jgi:DNA-binding NarL/FixJ family response regulator
MGARSDNGGSPASGTDVGVASPRPSVQRRLCAALSSGGFTVSERTRDIAQLVANGHTPATLVVHVDTLMGSTAALLRCVGESGQTPGVILVSAPAAGQAVRRAVDAGIDGLVFEPDVTTALVPTVHAVRAGQLAIPCSVKRALGKPVLSMREKQVLGMVVMGCTNGEIGARLYLAESTVKSHLSTSFSKLGVHSRNEAAALIMDPDGSLGPGILAISPADAPRAA